LRRYHIPGLPEDIPPGIPQSAALQLRDAQVQPLKAILEGYDIVVQMPTSGGKSLLFQVPAILWRPRLTVVISPLKALQSDQVKVLRAKGVEARLLNSSLAPDERKATLRAIREKALTLLYIAPEQLQNTEVLEALEKADIALLAVDEAHVLAHTQDSFRRSYRKIGKFVNNLPKRPLVAAFTATATRRDRRTIIRSLKMENMTVCVSPIRHKNLNLWIKRVDVKAKKEKTEAVWRGKRRMVESALREWNGDGSVILYCPTVKDVKRLHRWLKAKDWKAGNHHEKMADSKCTASQAKFLQGDTNIMVATNAFDLGIDKPDVRLIIHARLASVDGRVCAGDWSSWSRWQGGGLPSDLCPDGCGKEQSGPFARRKEEAAQ
jgi:ATP-dependent DNA helicase RecQ